jgi:D-alanyl-D-alanine endopeptidase (penicillin-binding protein 7)
VAPLLKLGIIVAITGLVTALSGPAAANPTQPSVGGPSVPVWKRVQYGNPRALELRSQVGLVVDEDEGVILYGRDADKTRPIASLTKLLTIMTLLDTKLSLGKVIKITEQDRDRLKGSHSSLRIGTTLTRGELMRIALIASDNRATAALARTFPGGSEALVRVMNEKTGLLGLTHTRAADASGLRPGNISTARDLARLAYIARNYRLISQWSTTRHFTVTDRKTGKALDFRNTNSLVHRESWQIALSKTGFTSEAGNCLLMRTVIADRSLIVVLLNSWGKMSKYGDSGRIRDWLVASERAARGGEEQAGLGQVTDDVLLQITAARSYTGVQAERTTVVQGATDMNLQSQSTRSAAGFGYEFYGPAIFAYTTF